MILLQVFINTKSTNHSPDSYLFAPTLGPQHTVCLILIARYKMQLTANDISYINSQLDHKVLDDKLQHIHTQVIFRQSTVFSFLIKTISGDSISISFPHTCSILIFEVFWASNYKF